MSIVESEDKGRHSFQVMILQNPKCQIHILLKRTFWDTTVSATYITDGYTDNK
jgi:hypothetical protein